MTTQQGAIRGTKLILIASALWLSVLGAGQAVAGGRGTFQGERSARTSAQLSRPSLD